MGNIMRITCPGTKCSKDERVSGLMDSCFKWLYSDALRNLISLYNGAELAEKIGYDRATDIEALHEFVKRWDFRNGKERWTVEDEKFVLDNKDYIMEQAQALGLVGIVTPQTEPDFIIPLGGARKSNYVRPMMAKVVIDKYGYTDKTIVALSGTRPIAEAEKPYVDTYAPNAITEYDAISAGLEQTFGLKKFTENAENNSNINLCSAVRKYRKRYKGSAIYSLAAPSPDPGRRANSYDTFEFLLKHFNIGHGDKLLLVTSCIYVPFQYLKFMKLAIAGEFEVDCIGSDVADNTALSKTSNYLQEIKGTVDAIYGLYQDLIVNKSR